MKKWLPLLLCLCLLRPAAAFADDSKAVSGLIKKTVDGVLLVLKDKKLDRDARREKVQAILEPILDMPLMAKLTLGRQHWPGLTDEQKKKFTDLFVEQLKASYFEKLDLFSNETVDYSEPELIKEKKYQMVTHIESKGRRVEMTYRLYSNGKAWRVYDIEIEGVSIIKSYGSQYGEFLQTGTFDALLKKMKEMIANTKAAPRETPDAKAAAAAPAKP